MARASSAASLRLRVNKRGATFFREPSTSPRQAKKTSRHGRSEAEPAPPTLPYSESTLTDTIADDNDNDNDDDDDDEAVRSFRPIRKA